MRLVDVRADGVEVSSGPPSTADTADLLASASAREEPVEDDAETDAARHTAIRADVAQLFRAEALDEYQRGQPDEAHLLEVEPRWMRHAYRVVLALIGAALLFGVVFYARFW